MQHIPFMRYRESLVGGAIALAALLGACDAGNTPTPRTSSSTAPGIGVNPDATVPPAPAGSSAPVHTPPGPPPNPPDRATGTTPVTPMAEQPQPPQTRAPAGTGSSSGGAGTSGMSGSGAAAGSGGSADERR